MFLTTTNRRKRPTIILEELFSTSLETQSEEHKNV